MKKVKYCLLIAALLIGAFSTRASAVSTDEILDEYVESLPEDGVDIKDSEALFEAVGFERFLEEVTDVLAEHRGELLSLFLSLLALTLLSSVCSQFGSSPIFREYSDILSAAVSALCGVLIFERLRSLIATVSSAIDELSAFFSTIVPIATALTASGGGTAGRDSSLRSE